MTTDVPSWIPSVEELAKVCRNYLPTDDAVAIRALVAKRHRLFNNQWGGVRVMSEEPAPERHEKAGEDLRECPTWYELRKAVESATTKWAREQFEGVDTSLADAEDAAVRELWNRRAPAQPARSTREERFNKSNALVQRAKPLIEALWAGAPTKPADSRMWLEAWTEHMKGHLSTCGYVQFDGMRVAMTGECLCPGDATPEATDFDDMEGRGPCGGSRCFLSHARDGVWIHSSKSYRTCSVRRAAPSRGERREAPASVERDAALEEAARVCDEEVESANRSIASLPPREHELLEHAECSRLVAKLLAARVRAMKSPPAPSSASVTPTTEPVCVCGHPPSDHDDSGAASCIRIVSRAPHRFCACDCYTPNAASVTPKNDGGAG